MLLFYDISLRYGQIDVVLRKMMSISSNLIGQFFCVFNIGQLRICMFRRWRLSFGYDTIVLTPEKYPTQKAESRSKIDGVTHMDRQMPSFAQVYPSHFSCGQL